MFDFRKLKPSGKWVPSREWIPNFQNLKLRLTLGSALLSFVVLFIIASILSHTTKEAVEKETQTHALELANYFGEAIAESVAVNDRLQVHLQTQSLLKNGAYAVSVTRSDGGVLVQSHPEIDESALYSTADRQDFVGAILGTVRQSDNTLLQVAKTVSFGDKPVGMLQLWLNRSKVEERIHAANAYIYPVFILGFFMMLLLGLAVLHTPFRAFKRLSSVAEQIGAGDLTVRVPVHGSDEIAAFCKTFNRMVDGLFQERVEHSREHLQMIEAMISTVEAKDSYTQGHCLRVQDYAREIMHRLGGLSPEEKADIATAALLHDIGKIGVPEAILLKQEELDESEMEVVRSHVIVGENILLHLDSMKESARWVRHHHERWDGGGYPDGLEGKAIPLASRIVAVADTIDAMMTRRPYRDTRSPDDVLTVFREDKGRQFDPEIVECALAVLEAKVEAERVVECQS